MKSQVLCFYNGSFPDGMAMTKRLRIYSKILVDAGFKFHVYSEKNKVNIRESYSVQHEVIVHHWCTKSGLDNLPLLSNIVATIKRSFLWKTILTRKDADVVFAIGYKWYSLLFFKFFCLLRKKKLIVELNEYPHSIIASRLQSNPTNILNRWIYLKICFRFLDGFIVISKALEELVYKNGGRKKMVLRIPILTDEIEPKTQFDAKEYMIFHAGTLTLEKDGILTVFESIGLAMQKSDKNIRFVLSNYQTLPKIKNQIEAILEKYKMRDKVIFHDFMKKPELEDSYRSSALVIINKPDNLRNRYNFSTKLGECMSYGLPIISTSVGESKHYLKDAINCLVIRSSEDAHELCACILKILSNPDLAKKIGAEARNTAKKHFHYSNYIQPFKVFLQSFSGFKN